MKLIPVSKLKGDEVLARAVMTKSYSELLAAGTKLKPEYINKLIELDINEVYIKYDEAQYQKFVKFAIDMGLDKLPEDVATIKDLLSALNDKVQNMKDYSGQLDRIIAKLDSIDWTAAENKGKLEQVIELLKNFKCNCECGASSGSNEGVLDDLDNIFG